MLEVAKTMIAEGGPEGFTIRELGRRAKVSVTTIYASFGYKEGLIAEAIDDYYQRLALSRARPTTSLTKLLMASERVQEAVLANKAYARQFVNLYFSASVDPRIHTTIRDTSTAGAGHVPWIQKAMRDGDIIPGLSLEAITTMLTNHRLLVLQDWAQGRLRDEDLHIAGKTAILIFARGITCGATQARVDAELRKLARVSQA